VLGDRVLRVDRVERLAAAARRLTRQGGFSPTPALAAIAGSAVADLVAFLPALGYRAVVEESGITFVTQKRRRGPPPRSVAGRAKRRAAGEDHPFAKLRSLRVAR